MLNGDSDFFVWLGFTSAFLLLLFLSSQQKTPALQDYLPIQQYVRVKKDIFKMSTKDVWTHDYSDGGPYLVSFINIK